MRGPIAPWIVILAGGQRRRLESFVRAIFGENRPKQFSSIIGTRSMLRHTWDRARRLVASDNQGVSAGGDGGFA
jgi:mannose-1-phosphate guanylyltransferase